MAGVNIRNVRKSYGSAEILHGIDVDIEDGEFIVMVGPSGCGKSTLLRMVAGLESITSGEIAIDGRVVNEVEPKDRDIAMVFQNYALYPHMSVYNNMAYGLKLMKLSKEEIKTRVDKAAAMLQLEEYLARRPRELSGGQRQRVAMGRAIVREPAVFLFDEPLSNLDAKLRSQMRMEIRKLQRNLDVTAIYVTHDQVEAMTMADRIVVLNDGYVEQIGTPSQIYHSPQSTFVASFMGAPPMNLVKCTSAGNGKLAIDGLGEIKIPVKTPHIGPCLLGMRPESVTIQEKSTAGSYPLELELVEELGAGRILHTRLGSEDFTVYMPHTEELPANNLFVKFPKSAIHLFDPDSGGRIQ
ncbi:MAG: sn-glycerol-3-phosphate ABC transporter ATP-binding protein UgpC [Hyphomicrobiales bacterium]|nr:sn-glycerol-3-phosphate ABC transporter ATP-binding protein UgpC [Hyphomicrobiales bacterium]